MGVQDLTFYHLLEHNARTAPSGPAVIDGARTITHRELLERVDRLAAGISSRGISKGDRVCILAQNSAPYFDLYGACAKVGAIAYPINWRLTNQEIHEVVSLADPQMIAVDPTHMAQLEGLDLDSLRVRALIGQSSAEGLIQLSDIYRSAPADLEEVASDDPWVIISTAAVAGVPRGAVLTHRNFLTAGYQLIASLGLDASDRHIAALPLFHITGLGLSLAVLQAGGANVVTEGFDPAQAARLIDQHQITIMASFPPILSMVLDARLEAGAHWRSLKYVLGLDAPQVIQRLTSETGAQFWTGFGQSETTGAVTMGPAKEKPGSAGKPVPAARVRLVDEQGEEVPIGGIGEIVVRGPMVFAGYWREADATDFTFRQGWHHTGDLGRFDAEGYLYYQGRKPEKELIKSGGENIYPAEVERVILELPQVRGVCVFGIPDEKWGETVKAVVELAPGESLKGEQVIEAVARRIASYKKPRIVEFVKVLPRLDDGNVDREAVKDTYG